MSVIVSTATVSNGASAPLALLSGALRMPACMLSADQRVASEGDAKSYVIGVVSGLLRCVRMTLDGRRHVSRFVRAGGFVGLGAHRAFRAGVEAVAASTIVRIPAAVLDHACAESAHIRGIVLEAMTAELAARERVQFRNGRLWADERVADFLLELTEEPEALAGTGSVLRMSRADMADHLGLTIETVSRALSRLQREGVVQMADAHHFLVVRAAALKALALGDGDASGRAPARLG